MHDFKRHCTSCASEFRQTKSSHFRVCSIACEEIKGTFCANCGMFTGKNVYCDRRCKAQHNKRKFYPIKGAYTTPEVVERARKKKRTTDSRNMREWLIKIIANKRRFCRKEGIPFNLTLDSFPNGVPIICEILGITLVKPTKDNWHMLRSYPSIDRIRPELGYVNGNVRIISHKANTLKNNATPEEAILLARDAIRFLSPDHPFHLDPTLSISS